MRDINKYTEEYLDEEFEKIQVRYRRKRVIEQVKKYNPKNILEIGCGMEPLFLYIKDASYTIVEPSQKFVDNAIAIGESNTEVKVHQGFFEEVYQDLVKYKYDMVICSSLLHEVENPNALLKAILKVCDDNTIVHVNVPNAKSFHRLLALESGMISDIGVLSERNKILQQHTLFTLESLKELCNECGFKVCDEGSYFFKPFTHRQMQQLMQEEIIDRRILDGFEGVIKYIPELGSEIFVDCVKD